MFVVSQKTDAKQNVNNYSRVHDFFLIIFQIKIH
jgi:hypothetical protein